MAVALVGAAAQALGVGAIGTAFLQIGTGLALSAVVRRSIANQTAANVNNAPTGILTETTTQGGTQSQTFILGKYATAGHAHAAYSVGTAGGYNNALRFRVIELSDLPVNGLDGVWVNDKYFQWGVDFTTPLAIPEPFKTPRISAHGAAYNNSLFVAFYDGTQTATQPYMLTNFGSHPTRPWLSTHIGTGVAYVVVAYRFEPLIWQGEPSFRAVVNGATLYDRRANTTGFIQNPVVQIANILRGVTLPDGQVYGMGIPDAQMDETAWNAAANACDQTAGLGIREAGLEVAMASPENGGMTPWDVVDELAKAGDIELADMGGVWTIRQGAPGVPVATITDDDCVYADQSLVPIRGLSERVNAVRGTYVSPEAGWNASELPIASNAADEAEDGERLIQDVALNAVADSAQAQKLLAAWRADARRQRVHQITLGPEYSDLQLLQSIAWTSVRNGYTAKVFEIVEMWIDSRNFETTLALRERDANDYQIGTLPPFTPVPLARATAPAQTLVGAAVVPHVITDVNGADRISAIRATWDTDAPGVVGVKYVVRRADTQEVVERNSTQDVASGELIISANIIQRVPYEITLEPVMATQETAPTAWLPVLAPNASLQFADFGSSVIPASALPSNNTDNWFLDQDMEDSSVYTATQGSFTLERTNVPTSGDYLMSMQPGTTVETDWMNINELTEYRAEVAAWLFPGTPGAGTVRVSIQLASLAADGLITSTRTFLVGSRTDSSVTDLHTVNFRTNGDERKFRFRIIREAGGTALGRVGGPRVLLRNNRTLITDEALTEVTRATVGPTSETIVFVGGVWTEIGRITVNKKTEAPVDVDIQFQYSGLLVDSDFRIRQGGNTIEDEMTLPGGGAGAQHIRSAVTDDQATAGATLTYLLQMRTPNNDTVTLLPRRLMASHTGT